MFQINGLHKFAEEDVWADGCQPDTSTSCHIDACFTGATTEEVIQKAADFLGIPEDGIERNACEEKGRVDFATTENENGENITPAELKAWKKGKARAWYAVTSKPHSETRHSTATSKPPAPLS